MTDSRTNRWKPAGAGIGLTLLVLGLACSDSMIEPDPDGTEKPPAELSIIRLPANHPPFFNDSASFYARPGRNGEARIYFQNPSGGRGDLFAELKLDDETLAARPDGTPLGPNDSVLVVMKVPSPNEILIELSPTGLRFNPQKPAELKLRYGATGGDLDGDGDDDDDDDDIERVIAIWRQEKPGDPFVKIGTVKVEDERELKAVLTSFSRYAISY